MNIDILISSYGCCPIIDCCVILFTNHLFIAEHSNAVKQLCIHEGVPGFVASGCYSNLFVHCQEAYGAVHILHHTFLGSLTPRGGYVIL